MFSKGTPLSHNLQKVYRRRYTFRPFLNIYSNQPLSAVIRILVLATAMAVSNSVAPPEVCLGEPSCLLPNNSTGVTVSRNRPLKDVNGTVIGEECQVKCLKPRRAAIVLGKGRAACGEDCQEPTSVAEECLDVEACQGKKGTYLVHFTNKRGSCIERCFKKARAARVILRKKATCGTCPVDGENGHTN